MLSVGGNIQFYIEDIKTIAKWKHFNLASYRRELL